MEIVLLHGLGRRAGSMSPVAASLTKAGYSTVSIEYPSRAGKILQSAEQVYAQLRSRGLTGRDDVGFVTQSLGGLVVRGLAQVAPNERWGRSVFLGCPINGSLLAAKLRHTAPIRRFFGPALDDLDPESVKDWPAPPCPFGIVAGTGTWFPTGLFVRAWAPGEPNDSTVLVQETWSPHALDHCVVDTVHSLLPHNRRAHGQILSFLRDGRFATEVSS